MKRTLLGHLIALLFVVPLHLRGWSRPLVTLESAVEDAELVVVATVIPDSIQRIVHKRDKDGNGGSSWHHRAKIRVSEILKGRASGEIVEIIIHYGLDPVTGHCLSTKFTYFSGAGPFVQGDPKVIGIWDTGGVTMPISDDIRQPHIWLLTRKDYGYSTPDDNDVVGIREPAHIQSVSKKDAIQQQILKAATIYKNTKSAKK